ncbi:MAG: cell division protein FtsQ/DivIB [Neisseriaceae bacterium]|nr:cell division protein FtsQ/DivIB [Neisseriaceae bacterium]MBR3424528.1 cell division protein FtsQ/DivIB [Neisseriaceae bacterium]
MRWNNKKIKLQQNQGRTPPSAIRNLTGWLYTILVMMVLVGGFYWLINTPRFPIRHIDIAEQDKPAFEHISHQELEQARQDSMTGNIFSVNLNKVKARFEQIVWAENVEVSRIWPDTIAIRVDERQPLAHWNDKQLIDTQGKVFDATVADNLPSFYGTENSERLMVEQYKHLQNSVSSLGLKIEKLFCDDRHAWQLLLNNGITVKLGRDDIRNRMTRFVAYWQHTLADQANQIEYVDMRYRNGFAVKLNKNVAEQTADEQQKK